MSNNVGKYIKNPFRQLRAAPVKYEPQYVSRGVEPMKRENYQEDFANNARNKKQNQLNVSIGQTHEQLWHVPAANPNESIKYNEIRLPPEVQKMAQRTPESEPEPETLTLEDFYGHPELIGCYGLLVRGELVTVEKDLNAIEKIIDQLAFDQEISLEEICVLQRLRLKAGVFVCHE